MQVRAGDGFGGQSGDALPGTCPLQGDALIFAFSCEVLEGGRKQCSLPGLGEEREREIAVVSSNPAGKAGRGLKWQLGCLC